MGPDRGADGNMRDSVDMRIGRQKAERRRSGVLTAGALILIAALGRPPVAQAAEEVDLELVLAVDISFSVDLFEAQTQRDGYIVALTHPSVIAAIQSGMLGKIAVTYLEWSDAYYQSQLVQWTVISDEASARSFAATLAAKPLNRAYYTSISHAVDFAAGLFDSNDYTGMRKVIDISGDGRQNQGRPLNIARAAALDKGITINGLPILNDRPQPVGSLTPMEAKLDIYYNDNVIGGPGAFFIAAEDFQAFRSAILSKLIREIVWAPGDPAIRFTATPNAKLTSARWGGK